MSTDTPTPSASPDRAAMDREVIKDLMELSKAMFDAPTMQAGYEILAEFTEYRGLGVPAALRSPSVEPADPLSEARDLLRDIIDWNDGTSTRIDQRYGRNRQGWSVEKIAADALAALDRAAASKPKEPTHG